MDLSLSQLKPGDRFAIASRHDDFAVRFTGIAREDGGADMDLMYGRSAEPVVRLTAQELYDTYDPEIYVLTVIGTAV